MSTETATPPETPPPAPPRRALYALASDLLAWEALVAESDGEITPELAALEEEVFGALEAKIDRIAPFIRQLDTEAEQLDAQRRAVLQEADWLAGRAKAKRTTQARLLQLVDAALTRLERTELKGELYTIKRRKHGGAAPLRLLVPEDALPTQFVTANVTLVVDKAALREALAAGDPEAALVAEIGERGYSVVVA